MFKRLLRRKTNRQPPVNKWYVFLHEIVKRRAKRAAAALSRKSNKLSSRQLVYCLYSFSGIAILVNAVIIISALQARSTSKPIAILSIPSKNTVSALTQPTPHASSKDYQRVIEIETFLDSIQHSEEGKKQYDSFIQQRPHFRDSIARYKELYEHP